MKISQPLAGPVFSVFLRKALKKIDPVHPVNPVCKKIKIESIPFYYTIITFLVVQPV